MKIIEKYKIQILLFLVIALASILRLYQYYSWSLSNDELSALNRLQYSNFSDLIKFGVMTDFHPAGIQVFLYYWVKLFGSSEASFRLPFIIAGIISVYLSYLIAARWFSKSAALASALAMSMLQYTVLYSQLARPYSFGLLFSLSSVWFWTNILFKADPEKTGHSSPQTTVHRPIKYYAGFVLSVVLAAYTQYFSALFVVIVYLTGLFFINKKNYLYYFLSAIIAILLYLPHINILIHQLSKGGVGGPEGWLGKPGNDWIISYLYYCFNNSTILIAVVLFFPIISIIIYFKSIALNRYHLICLIWFILPFIIGFTYSIFVNPVLQYSVLLFSFPFLLFFIFSFFPYKINTFVIIFLIHLGIIGLSNFYKNNNYYNTYHFGNFKGIAEDFSQWNKRYNNQITYAININHPYYINYYLNRFNIKIDFKQDINDGKQDLLALKKIVDNSTTPYFAYSWLRPSPSVIRDIIQFKFPYIIKHNNYNDLSEDYLFSKTPSEGYLNYAKPEKDIFNSFENKDDLWGKDESLLSSEIFKTGSHSLLLDQKTEFSPTFNKKISEITPNSVKHIKAVVWVYAQKVPANIHLVLTLESINIFNNIWISSDADNYADINKWSPVFLDCPLKNTADPDDIIKIYVWNNKGEPAYIDDLKISFYSSDYLE